MFQCTLVFRASMSFRQQKKLLVIKQIKHRIGRGKRQDWKKNIPTDFVAISKTKYSRRKIFDLHLMSKYRKEGKR